jgi:hypothetical protein
MAQSGCLAAKELQRKPRPSLTRRPARPRPRPRVAASSPSSGQRAAFLGGGGGTGERQGQESMCAAMGSSTTGSRPLCLHTGGHARALALFPRGRQAAGRGRRVRRRRRREAGWAGRERVVRAPASASRGVGPPAVWRGSRRTVAERGSGPARCWIRGFRGSSCFLSTFKTYNTPTSSRACLLAPPPAAAGATRHPACPPWARGRAALVAGVMGRARTVAGVLQCMSCRRSPRAKLAGVVQPRRGHRRRAGGRPRSSAGLSGPSAASSRILCARSICTGGSKVYWEGRR